MQYTLRNVPASLDQALRQVAREQSKSLNQVVVGVLQRAVGLTEEPFKQRDLTDLVGSWKEDHRIDAALRDQDRIDPEMWAFSAVATERKRCLDAGRQATEKQRWPIEE